MIWNYVQTAGLVSLHVVFQNLVAPIITSGKTTWGYKELQVFRKLEHGPWHYNHHFFYFFFSGSSFYQFSLIFSNYLEDHYHFSKRCFQFKLINLTSNYYLDIMTWPMLQLTEYLYLRIAPCNLIV